jgi:hypothetical protein
MIEIAGKRPDQGALFTITPKITRLFERAAAVHRDFEQLYDHPMQMRSSAEHIATRHATMQIGQHTIFLVGQRYYENTGAAVLHESIKKLEGKEKSSIMMIIEQPLRIVPEAAEDAMLDSLAIALAKEADIRYLIPPVSLSEVSVVQDAISLARSLQIDRPDILGSIVNSVAHQLNIGTPMDVKSGVEVMRNLVPEDVGIVDLYSWADKVLNLEPAQIHRLEQIIDQAAISSGHTDSDGGATEGGLFDKQILSDILDQQPAERSNILGFAQGYLNVS